MANGHYLEKDRLANLIAAVQAMGVADRPSGTLNRWVAELEASEELTSEQLDQSPIKFAERKKWQTVFEQHPEFFKTYTLRGELRVLLISSITASYVARTACRCGIMRSP